MHPKKILAAVGLLAFAIAAPLFAQSDRATITGTVKDSSSAVVPGVEVRVTNVDTNATRTATTNSFGSYRVDNLPIGNYAVKFTKSGFSTLDRKGVTLLIGQVAEIDVTLQVGVATQTVEVTSAPPILQTEDAQVSTNLNNEAVSELPINVQGSRNLSNFMFNYVPGVEGSDYSSHINGSMALTKEVLIDGTSAVSQLGGYISESQPPMEAMQEFEVDSAGIGADAGRSGGGVFKYEMKSGANQMHGTLFGFAHSTNLDAISAVNHLEAVTDTANSAAYLRKQDSMNDWGGSFGGAAIKDKLFYYFAFERYMQSMWGVGANTRTVPTDAMMGLDSSGNLLSTYADLSSMLTTSNVIGTDSCKNTIYQGAVFDPATECVFAGNHIPTSRISTLTKKILPLFHKYYAPESSLTANEAGPAYSPDPWFHNTQTSFKMDYNVNAANHLAGSFYWDDYPRINADQGGVWSVKSQYGGPMANSYWHKTTAPSIRLNETWSISPQLVNTAYATFNRFHNPSDATSASGAWDSSLGLLNGYGNFPLIYFNSGMYFSSANYQNGWNFSPLGSQFHDDYAGNTFIYSDELNWTRGRHNLKFGAEFRAMQFNYHTDTGTFMGGYPIIFDPTTTGGSTPWAEWDAVGNSFASFLLGDVYNAENNNPDNEYGRRKAFSWYATDDFKVNPRLTVNLSLRWDFNNPYKEKYGHWASFELNHKNSITGLMGGYEYLTNGGQSFEKRQDYYNYAPHIGAAYKIDNKTVARANFGVYFTPLNMNTWGGVPYQQAGNVSFHKITQEAGFNWDNGYNPVTTAQSAYTEAYTQADVVSVDPRALTPGNTWQGSVGVQRELDAVSKVDLEYIQSRSTHLQSGIFQTNQPYPQTYYNYVVNGTLPSSTYSAYNNCSWNGSCPWYTLITPYPQAEAGYGPLLSVGAPLGNADYKGLQFSLTRRAVKGLSGQASYVFSETHGDVDSNFQELWGVGSLQNIYDLKHESQYPSDFDVKHVVKGYIIYNLPFGKGKALLGNATGAVNTLVSGWSLNGDFHYSTGTPISIRSTNSLGGFNSVYVNVVSGCNLKNGSPGLYKKWLNTSCFANPPAPSSSTGLKFLGTGPSYFAHLRNPGIYTEDLGVHKSLTAGTDGRYNLTFRLEFFNVFNRHTLAGPDTNMSDSTFGEIVSYGSSPAGRVGQFGARFTF
jgi:hypothetical protein